MSITGTELRQHRQQLGLSQAKLAELTGVSQYLLSAFELEKADLSASLLDAVSLALADKAKVTTLAKREKRYKKHKYFEVPKLPDRVARAARTPGNVEYCRALDVLGKLHTKAKNGSLSALSLFSGCGGFSLGFSAAGFRVKGFLELEEPLKKFTNRISPILLSSAEILPKMI